MNVFICHASEQGDVPLPPHLGDEERLVRRRLSLELAPSPVDGEVLVEPDARDVLLEDGDASR
jgi:hypothetical protein